MIRLQTLGGMGLEDPERAALSQLFTHPKAFAFLCYLALAGPGRFCRREGAIGLFWPELDHEHGRAALRQTVRVLRHFLGSEAVVNRGDDEIGLNRDLVWCDATTFEELCEAGEAESAMALYQGDLIDGLQVAGAAPELFHWLDSERLRLRRRAKEMAWRCARERRKAGDAPGAVQWARRAVQLDPFDEHALRELLQLLDEGGDRAGAVREHEQFAARLATDFGVGPAAETQALIAAIRARRPETAPAPAADDGGLSGPAERHPVPSPAALVHSRASSAVRPAVLLSVLVLTMMLAVTASRRWDRPAVLRLNLVAVMPWRVSGADSGLAYLHDGMVDLLGATLTGERGLRSADPQTVLQAWRAVQQGRQLEPSLETALQLARRIGAGRLLQGSVVGDAAHLTLTATVYPVAGPDAPVAFSVSGTIDSLPWMVDRLTARLLASEAGDAGRLSSLQTTSVSALRAYLEGRAAFRRGLYGDAARDFDQALTLDSTFTIAALALAAGGLTNHDAELMKKGRRIAWQDSSRLSPRDRAELKAVVGPRYPAISDEEEYFNARERAVALAPESPEAWYWLADSYFHNGQLLGLPDWTAHARTGFERAIELDSSFAAPYQHLIELQLALRDTLGVRRLAATYFALDSTGEYRDFLRWRVAVGLGDSTGLTALRGSFDRMSFESLSRIVGAAQIEGIALEDAERAMASLTARTAGTARWFVAAYSGETLRSNEGRPRAALAESPGMNTDSRRPLADRWFQVSDALYGDGDAAAATRAIQEMSQLAEKPYPSSGDPAADSHDVASCAVALWRLHHHDSQGVDRAIRQLRRRSPADPTGFGVWMNACAIILEARLSGMQGSPTATTARARLDSLVQAGPTLVSPLRVAAMLELAELNEQRGDLRAALVAVQRRENEYNPRYLSTQLRQEGRLASLVGDRATAIRAYRHYLILRFDPEPSLRPSVDSARAVLAALAVNPDWRASAEAAGGNEAAAESPRRINGASRSSRRALRSWQGTSPREKGRVPPVAPYGNGGR